VLGRLLVEALSRTLRRTIAEGFDRTSGVLERLKMLEVYSGMPGMQEAALEALNGDFS
jgi:hypothetical protein